MRIKILVIFFLLVETQLVFSQDSILNKINIASPNAAALGKYGDMPVSYHTGTPQINIPLYEIKTGNISLPISISYHASGLKVEETASWVGAGWALNAGGVITRTVIGAADDVRSPTTIQEKGHYKDYGYNSYLFHPTTCNFTTGIPPTSDCQIASDQEVAEGRYDGEPDLFFFNFGGYSGKFYFRDDRTPILVPEQDLKIETDFNVYFLGFKLTTPDGTKYYFGSTANQGTVNPIETTKPFSAISGLNNSQPVSSWFLNKIESFDGLSVINLIYVQENYSFYSISNTPIRNVPNPLNLAREYDLIKNNMEGLRLSQITFPNGTVNFVPNSSPRIDLAGSNNFLEESTNTQAKALSSIQITNGNTFCKKIDFDYSYFTDNVSIISPLFNDLNIQSDKHRLKLNKIQETSCDGATKSNPYNFTYFTEQIPRRLSMGLDHWGYSNGITSNTQYIPAYTENRIQIAGANRDPSWPAMRAGGLQKITYPTSGTTNFEFEPHDTYVDYYTEQLIPTADISIGYDGSVVPKIVYINGAATDNQFKVINGTIWPSTLQIYNSSNSLNYELFN